MNLTLEQEDSLVQRLREGDKEAFESLVDAYRTRVYATLYNLLGRFQEAEEALWDVFAEIWKSIARFKGDSKLSTWVYSITTHVAYHRRRQKKGNVFSLDEMETDIPASNNLEHEVFRREESRLIERGIAKLPETLRIPLTLQAISGLDYQQISEILHVPVGALKTRVWRAKLELKKVMEPWMKTEKI